MIHPTHGNPHIVPPSPRVPCLPRLRTSISTVPSAAAVSSLIPHVLHVLQVTIPGEVCAVLVTTLVLEGWSSLLAPEHSVLEQVTIPTPLSTTSCIHRQGRERSFLECVVDENGAGAVQWGCLGCSENPCLYPVFVAVWVEAWSRSVTECCCVPRVWTLSVCGLHMVISRSTR